MTVGSKRRPSERNDSSTGGAVVTLMSPTGAAALGVIQLAGEGAEAILRESLKTDELPDVEGIRLAYLNDRQGHPIDQVLITRITCQPDVFEITCHGGPRIIQRIIRAFIDGGATWCDVPILTDRVYRLDGTVACDAYECLHGARTTLAVRFLLHQAHSGLSELYARIRSGCVQDDELRAALKYWPAVRYLLDGLTVVLVGPANSGKSTLLNFLAAHERALVADVPGTTRDYVQSEIELRGVPVCLVDTAGVGRSDDPLASQARERTIQACKTADVAVIILDVVGDATLDVQLDEVRQVAPVQRLMAESKAVVAVNRIDRADRKHRIEDVSETACAIEISALKGTGIDMLEQRILDVVGLADFDYRVATVFTSVQADVIRRALRHRR